MAAHRQHPATHPRWEAVKRSFKESNYITDLWNWLMTLMSKAAEMVLFATVLYSGYQLLPGVPHVPAGIDAAVFVIQQGALDIGGMGLLKLAKRAGLPKDSFPVRLGVSLVVLMILNVALASVKHTLPMLPASVFVASETVLLIARAIVAVLFGHAIDGLREEYGESTLTLKEAAELEQQVRELAGELTQVQRSFQQRLAESSSLIEKNFQHQFATELSPLRESLQQCHEILAAVPEMKAHFRQIESSTVEEVRRVKDTLQQHIQEMQCQRAEQAKRAERSVLRALPSIRQESSENRIHPVKDAGETASQDAAQEKFDARAFVFACLDNNADLKLAEIEQVARSAGYLLSQPTASRYRKQFFAHRESSSEDTESSAVKAESADERSLGESESLAAG